MAAPHIAVFGSSQIGRDDAAWTEAVALGRGLAEAGCVVVTGGYGGVMEAVSAGARAAGGHTIGLTVALMGGRAANAAVAQEIPAPDLLTRLSHFVEHADAFIALPGGVGTLLEISLLWNLKVLKAHDGPPLWLVGAGWAALIESSRQHLAIRARDFAHIALLPDAGTAVETVRAHFQLAS